MDLEKIKHFENAKEQVKNLKSQLDAVQAEYTKKYDEYSKRVAQELFDQAKKDIKNYYVNSEFTESLQLNHTYVYNYKEFVVEVTYREAPEKIYNTIHFKVPKKKENDINQTFVIIEVGSDFSRRYRESEIKNIEDANKQIADLEHDIPYLKQAISRIEQLDFKFTVHDSDEDDLVTDQIIELIKKYL